MRVPIGAATNDNHNPMPPEQPKETLQWVAIGISITSLLVSIIGWFVTHKLTVHRERQRAKEAGASDWIKGLTTDATTVLCLIQEGDLRWYPSLKEARLSFNEYRATAPGGIPFVKRTAILGAINEFCSITSEQAAGDCGQGAADALEKLITALRS